MIDYSDKEIIEEVKDEWWQYLPEDEQDDLIKEMRIRIAMHEAGVGD